MRKRRNVILGLATASWLAIACSTGSGAFTQLDDGNDRPPNTRENPGSTRENPGPGREVPPISGENPGTQGGGAGGGGGAATACPPCDTKLECLNAGKRQSISLKTVNGQCSAGDGVIFDCTGRVLQGGTAIGTWQGSGTTYTVSVTIQGQSQTLTCTRAAAPTPTGTGTGTATSPTGTTTSVPPIDAGTKG